MSAPRNRRLKIKTIGWVFIAILLTVGAVVVGSSFVINRDVARIGTAWDAFQASRSLKTRVVTALRAEIGFGGMIHHFKNFVLRHEAFHLHAARDRLNGARGTLAQYETLGMNDAEREAIGEIRAVLAAYDEALDTANDMALNGLEAKEIDRVVRVDDHPALRGLDVLDKEIARGKIPTAQAVKPNMLGEVRHALGYGGLIHRFKNYVLRQDTQRLEAARSDLKTAFQALDAYESEGVNETEKGALADIREVLSAYGAALTTAARLAAEGRSIEDIDRIVRIDEGPALRGLARLDREVATQSENEARALSHTLARASALTEATTLITAVSTLSLTALALWLLRARIVGPIGRLTGIVLRLADGDTAVRVDDSLLGGDEIGDMGRAVQVFRENAILRERAEEGLRLAKEEAERATDAKSEFLSSMSHELRTPMNAILGYAQLLANHPKWRLNDKQQQSVDHILEGGEHLLALINDILDLAQIESGKMSLSIEAVDPAHVVASCVKLARNLGKKRGIEVHDRINEESLPAVMADVTRLRQVLLNLLSNAVKYNRDGGQVFIEARRMDNGRLRFAISDTGPGIPEDKQAELFQPFSRLGRETTDVEGTGIGLTITRNLVERMDGEIDFVSTPGGGSTFWVELPLAGEDAAPAPLETEAVVETMAPPAPAIPVKGATVLYVEDNQANAGLMQSVIEQIEGVTMLTAPSGELGLEMAEAHKPDVILLDINLPGIDGFAVLDRLKNSAITAHIPVVAITAAAMPKEVMRGRNADFVHYLIKPIDVGVTLDAIREGLRISAAARPVQENACA